MFTRSSANQSPCLSLWGETKRIVTCLLIAIVEIGNNWMQSDCILVLCSVNMYLKLGHPFSDRLFSSGMVGNHASALCEISLFKGIHSALSLKSNSTYLIFYRKYLFYCMCKSYECDRCSERVLPKIALRLDSALFLPCWRCLRTAALSDWVTCKSILTFGLPLLLTELPVAATSPGGCKEVCRLHPFQRCILANS